ncbi:MAG TPA: hypothetical protein ENK99_04965 [Campylobacterales bacterium]|nr:hypothetical protein [Campylobacterales bacterium]
MKLPQNFNSPLKATGMIDYWKRWHITLTNFITSYIYTPIVRSFTPLTFNKAMLATIIVFLISGMWHGSGWTFIFWGFLHGTGVVINHYWHKKTKIRLPKYIAWFITFIFLNIGNVFFRSNSFEQAWRILQSMFDTSSIMVSKDLLIFLHDYHISEKLVDFLRPYSSIDSFVGIGSIFMIIIGFIIVLSFKNTKELFVQFSTLKVVPIGWFVWSIVLMGFSLMVMSFQTSTEFLYFDF